MRYHGSVTVKNYSNWNEIVSKQNIKIILKEFVKEMENECGRLVIVTDRLLKKTTNALKAATSESIESSKRRKIEYVFYINLFRFKNFSVKYYFCFTNWIKKRTELEEKRKQLEAEQIEIEKRNELNQKAMKKLE